MQEISGKSKEDLINELEGVIFRVPDSENEVYQNADEYLSGNIREKLNVAKLAAENDERYKINVEALTRVMPKDLTPVEISVRLGATWIPTYYIEEFARQKFKIDELEIVGIGKKKNVLLGVTKTKIEMEGIDCILHQSLLEG